MSFWSKVSEITNDALKFVATKFGPGKEEIEAKTFLDTKMAETGKVTTKDKIIARPLTTSTLVPSLVSTPIIGDVLLKGAGIAAKEFVMKPFSRAVATIVASKSNGEIPSSPLAASLYGEGYAGEKPGQVFSMAETARRVEKGEGFAGKISGFLKDKTGLSPKFSSPVLVGGFLLADLFPGNPFKAKAALTATKNLNALAKISDDAVEIASKLAKGEEVSNVSADILGKIRTIVDNFDDTKAGEKIAGTKNLKIVGNVNLSKFDLPEETLGEMGDMILKNGGYVEQRRGVRTWKDTSEAAATILPKLKLQPGKTLNAEEMEALGSVTAGLQRKVSDLSKAVSAGANDDLTLLMLAEAKEQHGFALASWSGATSEAGRSLNILRKIRQAVDLKDPKFVRQALELSGGRESVQKIAQAIAAFGDDEIAKFEYVRSLYKPSFKDYAGYYWYTNLLSGLLTHGRNIFGNLSNAARLMAARPLAAGIDVTARTGILGKASKARSGEIYFGEIPASVVGYYGGIKSGFHKAVDIIDKGYTLDDVLASEFRKPEVFKGVLPNIVSRFMEATDTIFRSAGMESELHAKAFSIAKKEGKDGKALASRMAELLSDPTDEMLALAKEFGDKSTFREDPGVIANYLIKGKEKFPGAAVVIPFVKTPANLIKQGFEMTPLGFIPKRGLNGRQVTQRQANAALGSLLLAPLALYAWEGKISGRGPENREERARLYREGWQPNSIKIGDAWFSYQATGPLAVPLAAVANAVESYKSDKTEINVAEIAARSVNSFLDSSFMSGLNSLLSALADPEYKGKQYAYNLITAITPGSQFFGQLNRGLDPTVRRADTVFEAIKTKFPGLSKDVTPMRNVFGEVVVRPGGFFNQSLNVLRKSFDTDASSKVDGALYTAGIEITVPDRSLSIGGKSRKMDEAEYSEYLRVSGTIKLTILDKLVDSPLWDKSTQKEREKVVAKVMEAGNKKAKDVLGVSVELRNLSLLPVDDAEAKKLLSRVFDTQAYKGIKDDEKKKKLIIKVLADSQETAP